MFLSRTTAEDVHRKLLTDFAKKIALLGAGVGLAWELFYFFIVLTPELRTTDQEIRYFLLITLGALISLAILLLLERIPK